MCFSGTPCVFRASITVFIRPRLYFLHFRALCGSFPNHRSASHFQMHPFSGLCTPDAPSAFEPVLCRRDSRQLCPLLFALYRVQGLLLVSLCSGRTFALPFTLGRPIVLLKATLCDAIVCRRGCKTRFYTRAIYHYAWQSKGNAPPFLQQSPCLIYVCVQRGGGCKSQPATACFT